MYAIIATGGKQYKVAEGDVIDVEKLDAQPGGKLSLDVLMLVDGERVLATPAELSGAVVEAEVVDQHKGEKVLVFKLKKRKRYHRTKGHRQSLTRVRITGISADGEPVEEPAVAEEPAAPEAKKAAQEQAPAEPPEAAQEQAPAEPQEAAPAADAPQGKEDAGAEAADAVGGDGQAPVEGPSDAEAAPKDEQDGQSDASEQADDGGAEADASADSDDE